MRGAFPPFPLRRGPKRSAKCAGFAAGCWVLLPSLSCHQIVMYSLANQLIEQGLTLTADLRNSGNISVVPAERVCSVISTCCYQCYARHYSPVLHVHPHNTGACVASDLWCSRCDQRTSIYTTVKQHCGRQIADIDGQYYLS